MPSDNLTLTPRQPTRTTFTHRRRWLAAAAAGAMGLILRPGIVQAAVDPASVAEPGLPWSYKLDRDRMYFPR